MILGLKNLWFFINPVHHDRKVVLKGIVSVDMCDRFIDTCMYCLFFKCFSLNSGADLLLFWVSG